MKGASRKPKKLHKKSSQSPGGVGSTPEGTRGNSLPHDRLDHCNDQPYLNIGEVYRVGENNG